MEQKVLKISCELLNDLFCMAKTEVQSARDDILIDVLHLILNSDFQTFDIDYLVQLFKEYNQCKDL